MIFFFQSRICTQGPRDVASSVAQMALRHTGEKKTINLDGKEIVSTVRDTLNVIHQDLLAAARTRLSEGTYSVSTYADMKSQIGRASCRERV